MLYGCRPLQILRLATEAVDILSVRDKDTSGRRVLARLVVAIVATSGASSIDPVGAVELGLIQVSHGGEEMGRAAALNRSLLRGIAGMRTDADAITRRVELL